MKFWMIANISRCEEHYEGLRLYFQDKPSFMHMDQEKAENELLRLAEKFPQGEFVLLEAVAQAIPKYIEDGRRCFSVQQIDRKEVTQ